MIALFALVASRSSDPTDLEPVLDGLGLSLADLAPAERSALVAVTPQRIELRHPLIREVVVANTPVVDQLRVYRALADHARGHLRAWYLAACTAAPDAHVAELLAAAASDASERGDHRASAQAWERASRFSPDHDNRTGALLAAATEALVGGDPVAAVAWCEQALTADDDPAFAARVEFVRGRANILAGRTHRAVDDLMRAADSVAAADPGAAARLCAEAVFPCAMAGRIDRMLELVDRSLTLSGAGRPPLPINASAVAGLAVGGRPEESRAMLAAVSERAMDDVPVWDLHFLSFVGLGQLLLEDFDRAGTTLRRVVDVARRTGSPMTLASALTFGMQRSWWTGTWAEGYADGTEALRWAEELGQTGIVGVALVGLGRIDAARGDSAVCRLRMDRIVERVGSVELGSLDVYVPAVLGLDALGSGSTDEAVDHLDRAWAAASTTGLRSPTTVPFAGDLVEAHIRAGNTDRAREALDWLADQPVSRGQSYARGTVERCGGFLAADLAGARRHFASAHAMHDLHDTHPLSGRGPSCARARACGGSGGGPPPAVPSRRRCGSSTGWGHGRGRRAPTPSWGRPG